MDKGIKEQRNKRTRRQRTQDQMDNGTKGKNEIM